jgi:glycosyltransferase involved in cell wall biosynthesis
MAGSIVSLVPPPGRRRKTFDKLHASIENGLSMATIALDATYTVDPMPSGIATYSRHLIEALAELESEHHFLLCYRLSRFAARKKFLRSTATRGRRRPTFSVGYYQQGLTFWLPWRAELFHSLAQRPPAFRFKHEVVTIHDIFPLTGRDYSTPGFQRKFGRLLIQAATRADRIITPSRYTRSQLVERAGVDPTRIEVIPEGVVMPAARLTPKEAAAEHERLVGKGGVMLFSVGVLQTRKNVLNALRALEILPKEYRMVLAGGDGYGCEAIHDFIRQRVLSSRVKLLGHVDVTRLSAFYQSADVFLFPSLEEGFGLPILEAMSHGLPVVAARTSSLPEVAGEAALYVDPLDPQDIAAKVREAAEDYSQRQEMTAASLNRARQFTWERAARATLQVYEEVLSS